MARLKIGPSLLWPREQSDPRRLATGSPRTNQIVAFASLSGKTTLASAVFDKLKEEFEAFSFVENHSNLRDVEHERILFPEYDMLLKQRSMENKETLGVLAFFSDMPMSMVFNDMAKFSSLDWKG
ncbi:hypothetical protein K1719_045810 [Acacia pycnantha]|nr:hypothetical protein K1719_045810 [Acacia pycnantha]